MGYRLLAISVLHYDAAVKPSAAFDDEVDDVAVSTLELKLAKTLIDITIAKHADVSDYHNLYNERMEALVKAKIAGREIATDTTEATGPPVINPMDVLKANLAAKKPRSPGSKKLVKCSAKSPGEVQEIRLALGRSSPNYRSPQRHCARAKRHTVRSSTR